jgi:ssDNA-binding Zn-finger/Zn-ribbon topoisomerase 1
MMKIATIALAALALMSPVAITQVSAQVMNPSTGQYPTYNPTPYNPNAQPQGQIPPFYLLTTNEAKKKAIKPLVKAAKEAQQAVSDSIVAAGKYYTKNVEELAPYYNSKAFYDIVKTPQAKAAMNAAKQDAKKELAAYEKLVEKVTKNQKALVKADKLVQKAATKIINNRN